MIKRNLAANVNADYNQKNYLVEYMQRLETQMEVLNNNFDEKIKIDQSKDEQIKQLHDLAHSFRGDLLKKAMEPLINEIIDFVSLLQKEKNDWKRQFELIENNEVQNNAGLKMKVLEKVAVNYFNIDKEINSMLKKFGILPIISSEGDIYNPNVHKIEDTRIVEGFEKKAGKIQSSIQTGYLWNNKVYRSERVVVYVNGK